MPDQQALQDLLSRFQRGEVKLDEAVAALQPSWVETTDARVDTDRATRCGFPEVVYAEGKSSESIVSILSVLHEQGQDAFATRLTPEQTEDLKKRLPHGLFNDVARTVRLPAPESCSARRVGPVVVIAAGTSDRAVAEEAVETLRWMHVPVELILDVGVAGPARLQSQLPRLADAVAIVVVAGMEGALPSVVGGYVACPVIGVPTSVGYGANFGGLSALLSMLNSCAANVTVVNIDAGFKGAYIAGLIATGRQENSGGNAEGSV